MIHFYEEKVHFDVCANQNVSKPQFSPYRWRSPLSSDDQFFNELLNYRFDEIGFYLFGEYHLGSAPYSDG